MGGSYSVSSEAQHRGTKSAERQLYARAEQGFAADGGWWNHEPPRLKTIVGRTKRGAPVGTESLTAAQLTSYCSFFRSSTSRDVRSSTRGVVARSSRRG